MEYIILQGRTIYDLEQKVERYLKMGWELHGSPNAYTGGSVNVYFIQAMTYIDPDELIDE